RISAALGALSRTIDSARIVTDRAELAAAAAVWSGAVQNRPAVVVRCRSTAEAQHALRTARECGLPVSVRSGGHDWTGRAIHPGALVIDLRQMREVSIRNGVATAAGGATADDVAAAA